MVLVTEGAPMAIVGAMKSTEKVALAAEAELGSAVAEIGAGHFGQRIGPFTAGTTHDHVLNFKIDMDVKGTANSLVKTTTRAVKAVPQVLTVCIID